MSNYDGKISLPEQIVANTNSQHLTEQAKNGTLEDGDYYVRREYDTIIEYYYDGHWEWIECEQDVKEVLAPVPTYDKYNELEKENRHLKSLLRKTKSSVRDTISVFKGKCIVLDGKYHEKHVKKFRDLLKKITEATKKKGILKNME